MEKIIPIVFACNDKVADICSVSVASIIQNSNKNNTYNIYIFQTRLSIKNVENLEKMSKENVRIKCVDISKYINFGDFYETQEYPFEMYYRLYAPLILDYNKIIYLDCDTIVVDDIAKLYKENIDNEAVGMVTNFDCYLNTKHIDYNSGVILMNCRNFENMQIREKCKDLLKTNRYKFPDQTALNIAAEGRIKTLGPKYNYQVSLAHYHRFKRVTRKRKYRETFAEEPIVIHFSYITKPYNNIYSKYNNNFWRYAKYTPYCEKLVQRYTENSYEVLLNSPVEDIYIDLTESGKVGLRKIFEVLFYQLKYWAAYKFKGVHKKWEK